MQTPIHLALAQINRKRWCSDQSRFPEAAQANRDLVEGQTVLLEKDVSETDQYDRLLRYVYVGDIFVNEELVRLGLAEAKAYPPDTKHQDTLDAAQRIAKAAGVGLWDPELVPEEGGPPTPPPIECLDAAYVADVTVPDNTTFSPGEAFVKTRRVRNSGDCPWPPDTQLRVIEDADLRSPGAIQVGTLQPGETIDISIDITAPTAAARYAETWRLTSGAHRFFGTNLTIVIRVQDATQPTSAPTQPPVATPQATQPAPTAAATAPPPAAASVVISRIFYDGVAPQVESDEYAEITNQGGTVVNLANWRLNAGAPGQDYTFPPFDLQPGQSCRIYTNEIHPETCGFSLNSGQPVWRNSGDCGYLFNAQGEQVSQKCY